jgi:hypothetical protein
MKGQKTQQRRHGRKKQKLE